MDRQSDTGQGYRVMEGFQKMRPFNLSDASYLKWLSIVWISILVFNPGNIEGQLFPVVKPIEITRMEPRSDDITAIWGTASRLRNNCSYRYIRWYIGERGNTDAPVNIDTGPPILRPAGPFTFGPWLVGLPMKDVANNSYADVFHLCKYKGINSPWLTKSFLFN